VHQFGFYNKDEVMSVA